MMLSRLSLLRLNNISCNCSTNSLPNFNYIQSKKFQPSNKFFSTNYNSSLDLVRFSHPLSFSKKETILESKVTTYTLNSFQKLKVQSFKKFSSEIKQNEKIRNVAIIAHVDHGKTTLVDNLLRTAGTADDSTDRLMDCNDIEKERGITIMSKNTSIDWKDTQINIVDTPGHGDFGGEVERIMNMVDSALLVVDANEGVMVQTRFVLGKALSAGLKIMLVLNKMDRSSEPPHQVESDVFDLMVSLGASDEQLDYKTYYASAYHGWVRDKPNSENLSMSVLLDAIVSNLPPPPIKDLDQFSMLVSLIDSEPIFGRILTGKIHSGSIKAGSTIQALDREGNKIETAKISKLFGKRGLKRIDINEGVRGDIVSIAGFSVASVASTLTDPSISTPIPSIPLDPPVLSMMFGPNDSPISGKEGKIFTSAAIKKRLEKEVEGNISFQLEPGPTSETLIVKGRGELQFGVLIENMRREGFELTIGAPTVLTKVENGNKFEPCEEVVLDVPNECVSKLMEAMSLRKANLVEMKQSQDKTRLIFDCPSRSLLGFRPDFIAYTRGAGVMNTIFKQFIPWKGELQATRKGVLVSTSNGKTSSHALSALEARGVLFCGPGVEVYPGMLVGEYSRDLCDLPVNPVKTKQLTNMRASGKDEAVRLSPPRPLTIESAISYIQCKFCSFGGKYDSNIINKIADEVIEVTPKSLRLRKRDLSQDFQKIQKK